MPYYPSHAHNCAQHHGHSHGESSYCWNPYEKGREWYSANWVPFLFWFGEYTFDGRERSGAIARYTRVVRLMVTAVRLLAMQMMVDSMGQNYREFLKDGAGLPLWFSEGESIDAGIWAWTAMGCMAINMLAILCGSAANHHKIQQYYDKQITLQEIENEKNPANAKTVPHGWDAPRPIFWVNGVRYLHDLNGFTGTVMSSIIFMSVMAEILGGSLGIAKPTLGKLFFASNMMALISVVFVPLTTWGRLWAHKKVIAQEMVIQSEKADLSIKTSLATIFASIKDSNEKTALYYHTVRACEHAKKVDVSLIKDEIIKYVEHGKVSVEKIKNQGDERLPWLDALNFIETKLVALLTGHKIEDKWKGNKPGERLLFAKMESRGMKDIEPLIKKGYLKEENGVLCFEKANVTRDFPTESNPHGKKEFVADFQTEKMLKTISSSIK